MRIGVLIFIWVIITVQGWGQQELTLFHLEDMPQAENTNPSNIRSDKWTFSAPSVSFNFGNTGFAYNDLIRPIEGTDSMQVDIDHVLEQMEDWNHLIMNLHASYFYVSHRIKNHQISLQVTDKLNARVTYPKELPHFLWKGNEPYVGKTVDLGPSFQAMKYRAFTLNYAYQTQNKVNFGVRGGYLQGLANFSTSKNQIQVHTDTADHDLTIKTNYRINTYHPERLTDIVPPFRFDDEAHGISLGLGFSAPILDGLQIAASLTDLGFIKWKGDAKTLSSQGNYQFQGVNLNSIVQNDSLSLESYSDTLQETFGLKETKRSFTTQLIPKLRMGFSYTHDSLHYIGLSYYQEMAKHRHPSITLAYKYKFKELFGTAFRFTPGISYSYRNRSFYNLGLSSMLGYKRLEIFIVGDNLLSWFFPRAVIPFKELSPVFSPETEGQVTVPRNFRNYNLRLGLNYRF